MFHNQSLRWYFLCLVMTTRAKNQVVFLLIQKTEKYNTVHAVGRDFASKKNTLLQVLNQ